MYVGQRHVTNMFGVFALKIDDEMLPSHAGN